MRTAYVLSTNPLDAETATTALRDSGYRPINPDEFGPSIGVTEQAKLALDSDVIVMVPEAVAAISTPIGAAILKLASAAGIDMTPIDYLVPAWRSRARQAVA